MSVRKVNLSTALFKLAHIFILFVLAKHHCIVPEHDQYSFFQGVPLNISIHIVAYWLLVETEQVAAAGNLFRFSGCFSYTDLIFLETGEGNVQTSLKGFHHWEVRKELQDAYNALINAAGQAGKHKLAESLFSEVPHRQAHE